MNEIASPCIKICLLDATGQTCLGCGRSTDEIGDWSFMSEPERQTIMARLATRTPEPDRG